MLSGITNHLDAADWSMKGVALFGLGLGVFRLVVVALRLVHASGGLKRQYTWKLAFTVVLMLLATPFLFGGYTNSSFGALNLPIYIGGAVVLALALVDVVVWLVSLMPGSSMYPVVSWHVPDSARFLRTLRRGLAFVVRHTGTVVVRMWRGWLLAVAGWLMFLAVLTVMADSLVVNTMYSGDVNTIGWGRVSTLFRGMTTETLHVTVYVAAVALVLWIIFKPINGIRHWRQRKRTAGHGGGH